MNDPEKILPLNPSKYKVERTDGSSVSGGKHESCEYFVLDLVHDKFSYQALKAYADACEAEYPLLARDLRSKIEARLLKTQ